MKRTIPLLVVATLFSASALANGEWHMVQRPAFMDTDLPDVIECKTDFNGVDNCREPSISRMMHNVLVRYDDGTTEVTQWRGSFEFECQGGVCSDKRYGNYVGRIADTGFQYGHMSQGYYLYQPNEDSAIEAHQWGTGPLAGDFPEFYIEDEASRQANAPQQEAYDLWCNPRGDTCLLTDESGQDVELSREELPNYVPFATDTSFCTGEVCYGPNGTDIIGLNPGYHAYN